jgi:hypothetical protein
MRLSVRVFRVILLVSVLLNLGDAPYLDEIFDAQSQQQQTADASMLAGGTPNSPQAPDPAKHVCSGYELLLHLYGVVHDGMPLPAPIAASERPPQKFSFVAFALRERIDRPPQDSSPVA